MGSVFFDMGWVSTLLPFTPDERMSFLILTFGALFNLCSTYSHHLSLIFKLYFKTNGSGILFFKNTVETLPNSQNLTTELY